jgi:hypothetical protein
MTWIVIHADDWAPKGKFSDLDAWCNIMATQKKGVLKTSIGDLSVVWRWPRTSVHRYLGRLKESGVISLTSDKSGLQIEIVNFDQYPEPTHQKKVSRKKATLLSSIIGKLPIEGYSVPQNMAIYIWRGISQLAPNHRQLQLASLEEWSADVEKMMRIDKRPKELIVTVYKFCIEDDFWSKTVRSMNGLRRNFDKINDARERRAVAPKQEEQTTKKGKWLNSEIIKQNG